LGHPLLLKTGAQLGFISARVPISSVFAGQGAVERPVALARRSGDEIGNACRLLYGHPMQAV